MKQLAHNGYTAAHVRSIHAIQVWFCPGSVVFATVVQMPAAARVLQMPAPAHRGTTRASPSQPYIHVAKQLREPILLH